jgi:hypothetical protein
VRLIGSLFLLLSTCIVPEDLTVLFLATVKVLILVKYKILRGRDPEWGRDRRLVNLGS